MGKEGNESSQDREADAKRNKSDRERQILYGLTWMLNKKKKLNSQNNLMVARGKGWGMNKVDERG